jgi:hypothetical protein
MSCRDPRPKHPWPPTDPTASLPCPAPPRPTAPTTPTHLCAHVAQALQELLGGGDEARVAHHRLQDQASNLALVGLKQGLDRGQIVVARGQGGGRGGGGDAGGVGQPQGQHTAACLDQELVRVAVVAAGELDDLQEGARRGRVRMGEQW